MHQKFIAYDIDGTLLKVESNYTRKLIKNLFERYGVEEFKEDARTFAGRTDFDIFSGLIEANGFDLSVFDELKLAYTSLLDETLQSAHVESINGVNESISFFTDNEIPIGLLTGNFERSAYIKLNRGGLDKHFSTGVFGCNHGDRRMLAEEGIELARAYIGSSFEPKDLIIVGDTPHDIHCAQHVGATAVAVTTGYYSREELKSHKPDVLLDSLSDTEMWFSSVQ